MYRSLRCSPQRPAGMAFSQSCILDEIDIFLVLLGHFIIVKGEAFAEPAYQKPGAAEEDEKLEDAVDKGIGFLRFPYPAGGKSIGAFINPFPIQQEKSGNSDSHENQVEHAYMGKDDTIEPAHRLVKSKEGFLRRHHDSQEFIMGEENKRAEGEERHCAQADERGQVSSYVNAADDVHNEENQKQGAYGGQKIGTQVVEGRFLHAVHRMGKHIGKNEYPGEEGNVPDPPEGMKQAFSCHEFCKENQKETFSHISSKSIPLEKSGNAQGIVINPDNQQQKKGAEEIQGDFLQRQIPAPVYEFFFFLF